MTFHLGWPQLIFLALLVVGLVGDAIKHGKPHDPYNAWTTLMAAPLTLALLYWGGFFK